MTTRSRRWTVASIAAFALMSGAWQLCAQEPPAYEEPGHEQAVDSGLQLQGELLWVDAESQTFAIQTIEGEQMQFRYDASTEVTGAADAAAGLATAAGTRVTVHYEETVDEADEYEPRLATIIEVHEGEPAAEHDPYR